jgi:hypothetical protein
MLLQVFFLIFTLQETYPKLTVEIKLKMTIGTEFGGRKSG